MTRLPVIDEFTSFKFLSHLEKTALGLDGLSYWYQKEYANELSPVVLVIFNLSIRSQTVPSAWKLANITSIPKESPLTDMDQLRPISITDIIYKAT